MNSIIKSILMIAGLVLLVYGIYTMIVPEKSFELGPLSLESQDNTSAYVSIGLGVVALVGGFIVGKKG